MATSKTTAAVLGAALLAGGLVAASAMEGGTPARSTDGLPAAAAGAPGAGPADAPTALQDTADGDTLTAAERAIRAHDRAGRGPEQPLPFSHRFHNAELQIECEYCHTGAGESQVVRMPAVSVCMGCHQFVGSGLEPIEELRGYASRGEPVPWERVYKVPEFVQFTHQPHLRNEIACQECHGPVEEMDRIYEAQRLTMGWCLECHRQEPAATDVATNAELIREVELPEPPTGRQSVGVYPVRISSNYAASRAPLDCATCHY